MPDEDATFGTRLKKARERHGLSRMDLANRLQTSAQSVARWEAGQQPQARWSKRLEDFIAQGEDAFGSEYDRRALARDLGARLARGVMSDAEVELAMRLLDSFEEVGDDG